MNWWRVASILLSVVLSLSLVSSPSARSVVPLHAVEFLSIEAEVISGDDGLVRVSIQLYANVDAQLNLSVDFSGPVDFASTANPKTILSMLSGETEFRTFDLIADQEKPSRAFFVLEAIDPPAGFLSFAQRFVTIVPRDGHTVVFCSDDPSTGQAVEIFPIQGPLQGQDGERIHHNVSITGHFKYLGGDGVPGHYGVYGAGCRFWFYNPSTGWWWHPLLGNIRHTHYDIIAEDGSFFSTSSSMRTWETITRYGSK